jgi:hypothetical protein
MTINSWSFESSQNHSGGISARDWQWLLAQLTHRGLVNGLFGVLHDSVLNCQGIGLTSAAGSSDLHFAVQMIDAIVGNICACGRNMETKCTAGDSIYLSVSAEPVSETSPDGSMFYWDPAPYLTTKYHPSTPALKIAQVASDGKIDPWYWPRVLRVASHPLSMQAAQRLVRTVGGAPLYVKRVLAAADDESWIVVLSFLLMWMEADDRWTGLFDSSDMSLDCMLAKKIIDLLQSDRATPSFFPESIEANSGCDRYVLMGSISARKIVEVTPDADDRQDNRTFGRQQLEFPAIAKAFPNQAQQSGYLALAVGMAAHDDKESRAKIVIHQSRKEMTKEITPGGKPLIYAELDPSHDFSVDVLGARLDGAAIYSSS